MKCQIVWAVAISLIPWAVMAETPSFQNLYVDGSPLGTVYFDSAGNGRIVNNDNFAFTLTDGKGNMYTNVEGDLLAFAVEMEDGVPVLLQADLLVTLAAMIRE